MKKDRVIQIANMVKPRHFTNPQRGRIYSAKGIAPAVHCCGGGGLQPKFAFIVTDDKEIHYL